MTTGTTVRVRARASDRAGNQGTSSVATIAINSVGSAAYTTTGTVRVPDPLDGDPLLQSGRLQITHPLDLDKSPGTQQSGNMALVYDSGTAGATAPIVQATIQMDNSGSMPSSIAAQLTWDGSLNSGGSWSFSGSANGDPITLAVPVMGGVTGVGRHTWSLTLTITTSGGTVTRTIAGQTFVVNLSSSPYGAGWNVGGVDRLYSIASSGTYPAGLLRVYGSGGSRFWAAAGSGNYTAPQGDNGTLVAVTGGWTYTTPAGDVTAFNSAGMQTGWTSADGNSTLSWTYTDADGDGQTDDLSTMTAIDGATTAFNYTSGKLSSVVTAGPRTWTIAQSSGNVTRITNPDGGQRNFTYDTSHRLTGESFAGLTNTWTYSSTTGTLQSMEAGSGGTTYLTPAVLSGLGSAAFGVASATVTDPLSRVTITKMDDQGRTIEMRDATGGVWTWTRDSNGRVSSQTDAMGRTTRQRKGSNPDPNLIRS